MADGSQAPARQKLECVEAQDALLGAMLMYPQHVQAIRDEFGDSLFSGRDRSALYRCILKTSPESSFESIAPLAQAEGIGDLPALWQQLTFYVSSSARMRFNAGVVQRGRAILSWIEAAEWNIAELEQARPELPEDCELLIEDAERSLYEASQVITRPPDTQNFSEVARRIVDRCRNRETPTGIDLGIRALDVRLQKVGPGNLCLVGARPGKGKTAMLLQVGKNLSVAGEKVLLFSLEMNREELASRLLANISGVNSTRIRALNVYDDLWKLEAAEEEASVHDIAVCDDASITVAKMRALVRRTKPTVVLVDYIQLVASPGHSGRSRTEEVGAISRGLKVLAKMFKLPVIAAVMVGREGDERPKLANLRESGSLEQDADQVVLLWDDTKPQDERAEIQMEAHVAKNRHGSGGIAFLSWDRATGRIGDKDFGLGTGVL